MLSNVLAFWPQFDENIKKKETNHVSLKFSENTVWIHLYFILTDIYQSWKGQHCSNHMGFFVENGQNFKYGRSNFTQ